MRKHGRWLDVLFVILAAVGVYLVGRAVLTRLSKGAVPLRDGQGYEAGYEPEAALRGRETTPQAPDVPASKDPTQAPQTPAAQEAPRHRLVGTLVGDAELPKQVAVHYADQWGGPVFPKPPAVDVVDGLFELDLEGHLGAFEDPWLVVTVDHPGFMRVERRIGKSTFVARDGVARATVRIELTRAGVVTGRVVDEQGAAIKGAAVAFVVPTKPNVKPRIVDQMITDAEGLYSLRATRTASFRLVAAATNRLPRVLRVDVQVGRSGEGPTIVLEPGAVVEGRLRGAAAGIAGAWLGAYPADDGGGDAFMLGAFTVVLREERLLHYPAFAETTEDGSFRFGGLPAAKVTIEVEQGGGDSILHHESLKRVEHTVKAPAHGVELQLPLSTLVVEVHIDGVAVPESTFTVAALGRRVEHADRRIDPDQYMVWRSMGMDTGPTGRGSIIVSADAEYGVSAEAEGRANAFRVLRSPPPGASEVIVLDLKPAAPRRVLTLRFPGDAGDALKSAWVAILDATDADEPDVVPHGTRVDVIDGEAYYEVERPGARLYVHPGASYGSSVGYWLPVVLPHDGAATKPAIVDVPLRKGCGLELDIRAPDGGAARVHCQVEAADGTIQRLWFIGRSDGGNYITQGRLDRPSSIHPPLPEGTYTVVLTREGSETIRKQVTLKRGKAVHLKLTYQ